MNRVNSIAIWCPVGVCVLFGLYGPFPSVSMFLRRAVPLDGRTVTPPAGLAELRKTIKY